MGQDIEICAATPWEKLPDFLTVKEAAAYFRVRPQTILQLINHSQMTARKTRGEYRIHKSELLPERPNKDGLFPCPFCGNKTRMEALHWVAENSESMSGWQYHCYACQAFGPRMHTREQAVEAWNIRRKKDYALLIRKPKPRKPSWTAFCKLTHKKKHEAFLEWKKTGCTKVSLARKYEVSSTTINTAFRRIEMLLRLDKERGTDYLESWIGDSK